MVGQRRRCRLVRRAAVAPTRCACASSAASCSSSPLDVRDVRADDALGIAVALHAAAVEPERLVAEPLDQAERVRDEQDRLAAPAELGELVEALVREALVADRQHLVDQQHVGIDVDRHGEAEAHVHARTSTSSPARR